MPAAKPATGDRPRRPAHRRRTPTNAAGCRAAPTSSSVRWTPSASTVDGRRCLDAGASTGGFTEVLLDRGAREVVAADVGYGQLAWSLRSDPRVTVMERTNVRELTAERSVAPSTWWWPTCRSSRCPRCLPALTCVCVGRRRYRSHGEATVRGRQGPGRGGGVVSDPALRAESVLTVARRAAELDWHTVDVTASPLPGPSGNVEYFLRLRARHRRPADGRRARAAVARAVDEGPQ